MPLPANQRIDRTGLPARRARIVERAWVPDGQVVPQQYPSSGWHTPRRRECRPTTAGGSTSSCTERRHGGVRCAATQTRVSPPTRAGQQKTGATDSDGAALRVAERRKHSVYPEFSQGGPQQLVALGSEVEGRWNTEAQRFLRDLLRVRAQRAPPALRPAARAGWTHRWWGMLSVAVQQTVARTALGRAWPAPLHPHQRDAPPLERALELAAPAGSSRLPLRP